MLLYLKWGRAMNFVLRITEENASEALRSGIIRFERSKKARFRWKSLSSGDRLVCIAPSNRIITGRVVGKTILTTLQEKQTFESPFIVGLKLSGFMRVSRSPTPNAVSFSFSFSTCRF